jgi:hypothetical protein
MLARQAAFRRAADAIAADLARIPAVRAIALFGSLARPLGREVPRFQPFKRIESRFSTNAETSTSPSLSIASTIWLHLIAPAAGR